VPVEIIALIKDMAKNNRLWGAERIRGELLKLDIHVCLPDNPEVYAGRAYAWPKGAKLEDVSTQSWGRDLGL
jgi:hypothetical protein